MLNEGSTDVYAEIFADVRDSSDLPHAIARAVRQLREAMEKEDNCAVTAAHVRNLREIDPAALATAYALAERTCTYWPTPGQIRELAGWSEESRSRAALQWVFTYLEKHGVEGRARGGGVQVRRGRDRTQSAAGIGSGDSGACDTGGDRSYPRCPGQRIGEAGSAVCKSTSSSQRLGQL